MIPFEAGLRFRPLARTARDTLEWRREAPDSRTSGPRFVGTPEREAEVLRLWHARGGG